MASQSDEQREDSKDLYREDSPAVASIRVAGETELARGWEFEVQVFPAQAPPAAQAPRAIRVRLSFADYEYWSHGATAPCRVIELLMNGLVDRRSRILTRESFDAARARREHPDIDAHLLERL